MSSCDLPSACRIKSLLSVQHRGGDSLIGAAATEISAHAFTHALGIVAGLGLLDQADLGEQLLLHMLKAIALCAAFDRQDGGAVETDRKRKARIDPSSVDNDRA